ncbi:hypothetical protein KC19_2G042800 [Ceratodon purpureus]|uniref:Uncharacterized protein n=1 Tax=Ceratodon purpureus TaxID=3225 RepID=A0A8T0IQ32_CERPU|nr:hypothetical protein KC19_2G042800 [Ceratodon purpureus]
MADKPARALVIYGDGIMPAVKTHHEHLHRLAASGSCGFLALRALPEASEGEREVVELAQLLDVYDIYTEKARKEDSAGEVTEDGSFKTLAERFMGMKSTFMTNSKAALALSKRAGFGGSSLEEFGVDSEASATASRVLGLLGFDESTSMKDPANELVFVHLDAKSGSSAESGAEFLDSLVGCVQESSKEGSLAYGRLFLVVVLGYGDAQASGESVPSFRDDGELPSVLAALRPRQSYTMKAGKPVEGLREEYPLLAVYNQVAVTRRDEVQRFLFEDFHKRAGNLVMLADRFLYEVAFKLWKAPKYGA